MIGIWVGIDHLSCWLAPDLGTWGLGDLGTWGLGDLGTWAVTLFEILAMMVSEPTPDRDAWVPF
ncbi:hypothetical protein CCP4SC76_4750014 [Gammaproteobacteria bacterium]